MSETDEMKIARLANVEAHAAITLIVEIAAQLIDKKIMDAQAFSREVVSASERLIKVAKNDRESTHAQLVNALISDLSKGLAAGIRPTLH